MKKPENSDTQRLFSSYQQGQDGPIIFRPSEADDRIKPPDSPPVDRHFGGTHEKRKTHIEKAAKAAVAFNKGKRMIPLSDKQIYQKGYDRADIESHMRSNWSDISTELAKAALECKWYKDGSCEINCDQIKWYEAHPTASSLHKLEEDINDPETRC